MKLDLQKDNNVFTTGYVSVLGGISIMVLPINDLGSYFEEPSDVVDKNSGGTFMEKSFENDFIEEEESWEEIVKLDKSYKVLGYLIIPVFTFLIIGVIGLIYSFIN